MKHLPLDLLGCPAPISEWFQKAFSFILSLLPHRLKHPTLREPKFSLLSLNTSSLSPFLWFPRDIFFQQTLRDVSESDFSPSTGFFWLLVGRLDLSHFGDSERRIFLLLPLQHDVAFRFGSRLPLFPKRSGFLSGMHSLLFPDADRSRPSLLSHTALFDVLVSRTACDGQSSPEETSPPRMKV